jgi:hypothetical protein
MSALLAMGVPHTADSSLYLLRLPNVFFTLALPVLVFYLILAIWVFRTVREGLRNPGQPQPPSHGADNLSSQSPEPNREASHVVSPDHLLLRGFAPIGL